MEEKLFTNLNRIRLQTFQDNKPAVNFYLKNGWVLVGQEKVPELGVIMLQFEKRAV
jgi:RimJ/RimL family protein N-acetyltransferase